jgi:hypothetical protein
MNANVKRHHAILQSIAQAMLERSLLPDFSAKTLAELDAIQEPATLNDKSLVDFKKVNSSKH